MATWTSPRGIALSGVLEQAVLFRCVLDTCSRCSVRCEYAIWHLRAFCREKSAQLEVGSGHSESAVVTKRRLRATCVCPKAAEVVSAFFMSRTRDTDRTELGCEKKVGPSGVQNQARAQVRPGAAAPGPRPADPDGDLRRPERGSRLDVPAGACGASWAALQLSAFAEEARRKEDGNLRSETQAFLRSGVLPKCLPTVSE